MLCRYGKAKTYYSSPKNANHSCNNYQQKKENSSKN